MEASYVPLNPLKWYGKVLAVWPISGSKYVRLFCIFYECLLFSSSFVVIWFYKRLYETGEDYSPILYFSRFIFYGVYFLHHLTIIYTTLLNKQHLNVLLHGLGILDGNLLDIMESEQDVTEIHKFQYLIMIAFISIQLPMAYLTGMIFRSAYIGLAYLVTLLRAYYINMLLTAIAHVIQSRYRSINTQLSLLQDLTSTSVVLRRLKKLTKVHRKLCGIVRQVNSMFAIQFLILLLFTVIGFAVVALDFLHYIKNHSALGSHVIVRIYFIFRFYCLFIVIIEQCRSAALEGNRSVLLVHRLQQRSAHVSILNEVENFSLSMNKNYVKFSAGDIQNIDRNLLFKIVISVTTYLVISLQIEDLQNAETGTTLGTPINTTINSPSSLL